MSIVACADGPDVHVVVVHYRSRGQVADCVRSIDEQDVRASIVVVDCGPDGSTEALGGVRVLDAGGNLGYAGGNNLGLSALPDDDVPVLLVNPDVTLLDPDCLSRLVSALALAEDVGGVAPILYRNDGLAEHTGSTWDPRTARALHTGAGHIGWPYDRDVADQPWLNGACLLLERAMLRQLGGFDERFFLYFEESDLCLRARAIGWRLLLVPARAHHRGSASFAGSTRGAYYAVRNRHLLGRKHGRGHAWRVLWLRECLGLLRRSPRERRAVSRGVRDALRRRYGALPEDRVDV